MQKENQLRSYYKNNLSSREVVARDLPHPMPLSLLNRKQQPYFMREAEDPGTLRAAKLSGMTPNLMGFTLIELLVVVLIIGILAAVALPQYTLAVNKSRFANLRTTTQSFVKATQAYYLANNEWPDNFDVLAVDAMAGFSVTNNPYGGGNHTGTCASNNEIYCCILPLVSGQPASVICGRKDYSFSYQQMLQGWTGAYCVAKTTDTKAMALCRAVGNFDRTANMASPEGHKGGYSLYKLP